MKHFATTLAAGLLLALIGCDKDIQSPGDLESATDEPALAAAAAAGLSFYQVSAGGDQTCGVTTEQKAYCWGGAGRSGDGTLAEHHRPAAVAGNLRFLQVSSGTTHA